MAAMNNISLTDEQKHKLQEFVQSAPELIAHRAQLILAYAEGKPTLQAAQQAGISRGRARYWKRQFTARGMEIFAHDTSNVKGSERPVLRLYAAGDNFMSEAVEEAEAEIEKPTSVDYPYPRPLTAIGIGTDDSLAEAGRKVWLYHFAIMLSREPGTLRGENIEELHDMRVAIRRMRTAFDIFGQSYQPKIMKHYLKGLRGIGRALGQVRDMDVILEKALVYQADLQEPQRLDLEPLISAWKRLVEKKRRKLVQHLQSEGYEDFKRSFNSFLQAPQDDLDNVGMINEVTNRVRDAVPVLVYSRYAAVRAYEAVIPTANASQLHALRIEFKKFRYTLEYFREVLGDTAGKAINEIKRYQDHLGELHDADVACQLVRDFLVRWEQDQANEPIDQRTNPETVASYLAYLYAERHRLTAAFPQLWRKFNRTEFRHDIAQAISVL